MAIKKDLFREWYLENCLTEPFLKSMNISHFFMERDDSGHPACFLEVAKEPIDNYQSNYFLTSLPRGSRIPCSCFLVLYSLEGRSEGITAFRVKRVFPTEKPFQNMTPGSLIGMIESIRAFRNRLLPEPESC